MTLGQFFARIAFAGIAIIGITIAVLFAVAGDAEADFAGPDPSVVQPAETEDAALAAVFDEIFNETGFEATFTGNGPFRVAGDAIVSSDDLGQRTLRFTDNFRANRGPELVVYLRADSGQFINLGALQAIQGEQFYEIPGSTDITVFDEVQIWDEQNSVAFGSAFLSPAEA